jgi:hypothetical protein
MVRRIRLIVYVGAGFVLFAACILNFVLDNSYVQYPVFPNPKLGETIAYSVRSVVVYITKDQRMLLDWIRWTKIVSGGLLLASVLSYWKWPIKSKSQREAPNHPCQPLRIPSMNALLRN